MGSLSRSGAYATPKISLHVLFLLRDCCPVFGIAVSLDAAANSCSRMILLHTTPEMHDECPCLGTTPLESERKSSFLRTNVKAIHSPSCGTPRSAAAFHLSRRKYSGAPVPHPQAWPAPSFLLSRVIRSDFSDTELSAVPNSPPAVGILDVPPRRCSAQHRGLLLRI